MQGLWQAYSHKIRASDDLLNIFGVSAESDNPNMHFLPCLQTCHRATTTCQHRTVIIEGWCRHNDSSCTVCEHYTVIQRLPRDLPQSNCAPKNAHVRRACRGMAPQIACRVRVTENKEPRVSMRTLTRLHRTSWPMSGQNYSSHYIVKF